MFRVRFNGSGAQPTIHASDGKLIASVKVRQSEKEARELACLFRCAPDMKELILFIKSNLYKFAEDRKDPFIQIEMEARIDEVLKRIEKDQDA